MAFAFQPSSSAGNSSSHEYDLLLEMVRLQAPPSTPIHNKAMCYNPCSQKGARLDYYYREEGRLRWTQPRVFRWRIDEETTIRRSNTQRGMRNHQQHLILQQQQQQRRRYKIRASKLVTVSPWGEFHGLGSTQEQQQADEQLILGTRLKRIIMPRQEPMACFEVSGEDKNARSILRMLRVASRGNFLQTIPPKDSFHAPWLEPTRSWFTLSKYLASRFELALWESYRHHNKQQESLGRTIRGLWDKHDLAIMQRVCHRALPLALQEVLRFEQGNAQLHSLRDGILWALIDRIMRHDPSLVASKSDLCRTLSLMPLMQVDCPYNNHFLSLLLNKFEACWIREQEQNATKVVEELVSVSNGGVVGKEGSKKWKAKRNKKKKRNGGKTKISRNVVPLPVIPADSEGELEEEKSFSHENKEECFCTGSTVDFPDNGTPALDRNRNIITVLGIMEDVLEDAFEKVGLPRTPAFVDQREIEKEKEQERKRAMTAASTHSESKSEGSRDKKTKSKQEKKSGSSHDEKRSSVNIDASLSQSATGVIGRPLSFDLEATEQYRNPESFVSWGVPMSNPYQSQQSHYQVRPFAFAPFPDTALQYSSQSATFAIGYHDAFSMGRNLMLGESTGGIGSDGGDDWPLLNCYHTRDESIFSDFFSTQDSEGDDDDDEGLMAASTAASISSSTYKDTTLIAVPEDLEGMVDDTEDSRTSEDEEDIQMDGNESIGSVSRVKPIEDAKMISIDTSGSNLNKDENEDEEIRDTTSVPRSEASTDSQMSLPDCRSPSPEAPVTPPPTLSPILLSLADLKDMQHRTTSTPDRHKRSLSTQIPSLPGHGSLPSSPIPPQKHGLTSSWSRDDLRIQSFRDDQRIKQSRRQTPQPPRASETPSYKSVAAKSLARPIASTKGTNVDFRLQVMESNLRNQYANREPCARSETALDGEREEQHTWHHEDGDSPSIGKDEITTITSLASQRIEPEELNAIREERNNFRDMCLTLGAEVARLKAMLAAQQATSVASLDYQDSYSHPMVYNPGSFDPHGMQPFFRGMNSLRPGPMSDAGFQRGEHESQVSEDEVYEAVSRARDPRVDAVRRMSSSQTITGSDVSVDFNNSNTALSTGPLAGTIPMYDAVHSHGLQSRLTKDILQFLSATNTQLRKLDTKRKVAVERFSRLVKTIWPRAQVKLYGSYMSGLCLPSSDLDFVVCLPAVHKKDLALAPGVLEGRNAINETSQKLLARELKGESWIDPRSIKLIDRTIVPVIKVSTKDTRARVIQLDISFDSPEHHGLEANQMVAAILDELPLIRPLMLVLKQFLLDRGLLTAYTGGLSSYCLFLMLARYLQEQPPTSGDPGSLLMGFLDFYGNYFDPRATGISVMRRQYFARANHHAPNNGYQHQQPAMWTKPRSHQHSQRVVVNVPTQMFNRDFRRRNSFSETGSVDGNKQRQAHCFPPTPGSASSTTGGGSGTRVFVPRNPVPPQPVQHPNNDASNFDHVRPFTFDPLFVEDPLSASNNVGRNAFRINQVQRSFSDAHRALLASLDWDIQSTADGVDYPLLKCLLQGEDVLYEL